MSSNNKTRTCEDTNLLLRDSNGEEVFVSPDFHAWFPQVIFRDSCIAIVLLDTKDNDPDDPPTTE